MWLGVVVSGRYSKPNSLNADLNELVEILLEKKKKMEQEEQRTELELLLDFLYKTKQQNLSVSAFRHFTRNKTIEKVIRWCSQQENFV